jgi:multidrug resistance efflux pump
MKKALPSLLGRGLLLVGGILLTIWGARQAMNRATAIVSSQAFVNGYIATLTAGLQGQIQTQGTLKTGLSVIATQPLFAIWNSLADPMRQPWIRDTAVDLAAERSRLQSLEREYSTLASQTPAPVTSEAPPPLEPLGLEESVTAIRLAAQSHKQAEIALATAQEAEVLARSKAEKFNQLTQAGATSVLSGQEAFQDWLIKQQGVAAAQVELEKRRIEWVAQEHLLETKQQERARQQQHEQAQWLRAQQTERLSQLRTTTAEQSGLLERWREIEELRSRIQAREQAVQTTLADSREQYRVVPSPYTGVLWELWVRGGEQVSVGQALGKVLDCQSLWVDAFVSVDAIPKIQVGQFAQVQLLNGPDLFSGKVRTIRSRLEGNQKELGGDTAIQPPNIDAKQLAQIRVELDQPLDLLKIPKASEMFCHVGQLAEVKIPVETGDTWLGNPFQISEIKHK